MKARRSRLYAEWWLLPVVVVAGEVGVMRYLATTPVSSRIQSTIEADLLSSDAITTALTQHLEMVALSFLICVVVGIPVGVILARAGAIARVVVLGVAVLGQAVPSIAVLALASAYIGLGLIPTVLALVAYGLLPLLRNTVVGLDAVETDVLDAARGMGMSEWQILRRVQLPLASPVILAGVRTALVLIVGTATLGNFIGAGGLGDLISEGISAPSVIGPRVVLAGAAMAAGLALLLDWAAGRCARVIIPQT